MNPSRETKFAGANGDRRILNFPVQLTTGRIGNFTRFIHTLLLILCDDHSYIQLYRVSNFFGVCVLCFLPIHSGHQVRWTYQPGSHRRKVTQDFKSTFVLRCVP